MRKASVSVERNADKLVKDVAIGVLTSVVRDTPVDTGQAKSNWQVAMMKPASGTRAAYVPGEKGSTSLDNTIAAIEMGQAKIENEYISGSEIHITNNLEYITDLNDGASSQAPPGYVQEAVLEALGKIQVAGFSILHDIEV